MDWVATTTARGAGKAWLVIGIRPLGGFGSIAREIKVLRRVQSLLVGRGVGPLRVIVHIRDDGLLKSGA